jgi:hypothetical protein
MQGSKIFLSSSRYESFGLAMAEANACGCTLVGLLEILVPGNGSLPPKYSFGGSAFNLLAQEIHIASIPNLPAASLFETARPCSAKTIAQRILLTFA